MPESIKIPLPVKIIIGFHILNLILWTIGQGGALVAYDTVAEWGLQEPRELIDPVMVEVNRGIGLADVIVLLPLFVVGVIGLWRMRFYGAVFSWMALGITLYWPIEAWGQRHYYKLAGLKYQPFDAGTLIFLAFLCLFAIWASWYLFRNRKLFG